MSERTRAGAHEGSNWSRPRRGAGKWAQKNPAGAGSGGVGGGSERVVDQALRASDRVDLFHCPEACVAPLDPVIQVVHCEGGFVRGAFDGAEFDHQFTDVIGFGAQLTDRVALD